MRIEWHIDAVDDLKTIATGDQRRIKKALEALQSVSDPRQRLVAYSGNLSGFWKLRVGHFRLICQIREENGVYVMIIRVAHRSVAYDRRRVEKVLGRGD